MGIKEQLADRDLLLETSLKPKTEPHGYHRSGQQAQNQGSQQDCNKMLTLTHSGQLLVQLSPGLRFAKRFSKVAEPMSWQSPYILLVKSWHSSPSYAPGPDVCV